MSEFQQIDNATTEFNTISALNENPEDNQVVKDLDFQNRIDFNKKCEPVRQVINNINDTKLQLQICNKTVPATDENNLSQELIQTPECVEIDLSNTGPFPRTPSHINTQMKTTQSINNTNINNVIILESQIDRQNICAQENSQIKLLENLQMLSINTSEKTKIQHSKPNESMTQLSDIIPSTQFDMEPKNHTKINKNNQNKTVETKEIQKSPYDWVKTIKAVIQPSKHQFMPRNILPEAFWLNPFAELPPEWKNDFDTW